MGAAMSAIKANPDMVKAGAINPIKAGPEVRLLSEEEQQKIQQQRADEQKRKVELQKKLGL